ncbi:damage-inducible protein CinA [Paenibacillus swuensis]|uniref:Putative competence-damage inducible protein n=1 Tax=Paenibacillus swuensis TaxID=1178515 RepID=A0A172TKN3_9BACL|nr:competence/damage-inducible protein A [Paenibacillus swuensis]ANE47601.1 damage-inducible protein CinA [Paenibacillus swuensis]
MKAEIIAVGTELLLGQIVNTNAQYIAQECAHMGLSVHFQTVVGDNPERIRSAVEIARGRADVVIFTGGLGPTQDDLTKDVLAQMYGRKMLIHEPSMDAIRSLFSNRGAHMVESNIRQANWIEGSDPLKNETGLAVGNALTIEGIHYILLPGPPKEMKPMFKNEVLPWLHGVMKVPVPLHSKMLKFAGIGESNLEHAILDLIDGQTDPTLAPYAKEGEVTVRVTTRALSIQEAELKMMPVTEEIYRRLGAHLYAERDIPIEAVIIEDLAKSKRTLAVAESCTGGGIGDKLTMVPGSGDAYLGGIVCYSNDLKHKLLGVPMDILEGENAPGAVSSEAAISMAEGMLSTAESDYALSVTGVAGPGSSEGKPAGLVYIGLAVRGRETVVRELQLSGNRESVKLRAAKSAFYMLWRSLQEESMK